MPTEEEIRLQKEADAKELSTLIHSAVATHLKGLRPKLLEEIKSSLGEAIAPMLTETLKAQLPELLKTATPTPEPGDKAGKKDPEFLALQGRFDTMERTAKAERERAEKAERERREDSAYGLLRTGLAAKVRPEMLDTLAKVLFHADKRVEFDDKGSPLFKIRRAPMTGMAEEDALLPLSDGIEAYLKSKDAEPFLPPPKTQIQSGPRRPAAPTRGSTGTAGDGLDNSSAGKIRRSIEREAELAEQFPNLAR